MSVIQVSDAAVAVARTRTIGLNLVHPLRTPITSQALTAANQAPTAANLNATTEVMLCDSVFMIPCATLQMMPRLACCHSLHS